MAIIFALTALLGYGIADLFGGVLARRIGSYSSAFWAYVISVGIASLYIPFAWGQLARITLPVIILLAILVPIGIVPLIALYEGMKRGNASLAGTIGGAFSSIVVILSVIFLGDRINTYQILSIVLILVGLFLSSVDRRMLKVNQLFSDKGVPYAIVAMVLWGIYYTFIRIPVRQIGWFWPAYFSWWGFPLVYVLMRVRKIELKPLKGKQVRIFSLLNAVLLVAALFAYNQATAEGQTAVVAPIAGSYPVLFVILAYFVFKDRLSKQQIGGIIVTLIGIVLLSVL
jgi:drug/metabolite transporter (DMT)-like permease